MNETKTIHWSELLASCDNCTHPIQHVLPDDSIVLDEDGSLAKWPGVHIFDDRDGPDWDTTRRPVDWSGFAEVCYAKGSE